MATASKVRCSLHSACQFRADRYPILTCFPELKLVNSGFNWTSVAECLG